jgi:NADPH2:quinone reductase
MTPLADMLAIVVREPGGPGVLVAEHRTAPVPGPGEALVAVAEAGVNFADVVMRSGDTRIPTPFVPGVEGSGRVVAVGDDVTEVRAGDRVSWAPVKDGAAVGSYAEFVCVPEFELLPLPDDVSFELAAAVTLQGLTAHYLATEQVPVGPATTAVVHAAAGGTGGMTVQWLRHLGATVIGTVSTAEKARVAASLGADHVIVLGEGVDPVPEVLRLTGGRGADYVVDGVTGPDFRRNLAMIADRGRVCVFGRAGGLPEPFSPLELVDRSATVAGAKMTNFLRSREEVLRKIGDVWTGVREGWLAPRIHATLPLTRAAEAHRLIESRATAGKLLLRVSDLQEVSP